ncbi:hypothetical protein DEAC_c23670 [Desulfosporosinus acididurans]|uniref:Uncharacterized protein n=1 Tax=Desulfosporosinus acididurans TaxID=476652 RepID=A0A0J1FR17_9FIRM|nr:hypothetical protein [Desulfosporosinus acididurans]KLU65737.1 hypothetical protein DEAC_c23670 [Desulfosporosinus acididurans]
MNGYKETQDGDYIVRTYDNGAQIRSLAPDGKEPGIIQIPDTIPKNNTSDDLTTLMTAVADLYSALVAAGVIKNG